MKKLFFLIWLFSISSYGAVRNQWATTNYATVVTNIVKSLATNVVVTSPNVVTNGATFTIALGNGLTNNSAAGFNGNGAGLTNIIGVPQGNTAVTTMSGDITLTSISPRLQLLTPDANRNVTLPASGLFNGDTFTVHVDGGTAFVVTLKNNGGTTLGSLPDATTHTVVWNGTSWLVL